MASGTVTTTTMTTPKTLNIEQQRYCYTEPELGYTAPLGIN